MKRVLWRRSKTVKWYAAICQANARRRGKPQSFKAKRANKRRVASWRRTWEAKPESEKLRLARKKGIRHRAWWASLTREQKLAFGRKQSRKWTPELRERAARSKKEHWKNPIASAKHRAALVKRSQDPKYLAKLKEAANRPERLVRYAEQGAQARASLDRPNGAEKRLRKILTRYFPGVFKLNVRRGLVIGNRVPDFVGKNGQKILIELFGNYWHGCLLTGRSKQQEENKRKRHFRKFGYVTVIIWELELQRPELIVKKISKIINVR